MKIIVDKKIIFGYILGAISFGIIGISAAMLSASEISYKDTTVKDAIDQLYDISSKNKISVYKYAKIPKYDSSQKKIQIDIKNDYSNYKNITIDNIFVQLDKFLFSESRSYDFNALNYSYDNENGFIMITSNHKTFSDASNEVTVLIYE